MGVSLAWLRCAVVCWGQQRSASSLACGAVVPAPAEPVSVVTADAAVDAGVGTASR